MICYHSQLLPFSSATVARRFSALGLKGSGKTTKLLPDNVKRQLVADQLEKDPLNQRGPKVVKERIARDTPEGIHLTRYVPSFLQVLYPSSNKLVAFRDYVTNTMRELAPEGFDKREPTARKIVRTKLVALGPNHEWSGDGHDKLASIGWPIYGVRDKYSGKWLLLKVLPNNRLARAIGYVYLQLIHKVGGMPIQTTTDCGSETGDVYGLTNALRYELLNDLTLWTDHLVCRETFSDLPIDELPAHRFLKSVHNITIEKGWLRLRLEWGDNVHVFWNAGMHLYNPDNEVQA